MLTFSTTDLVIVLIAGFILLVGLSFLALRRRDEMLQDFLTPEEPDIETEFFKKRPIVEKEAEEILPEDDVPVDSEKPASWDDIDAPSP